MTSRLLMTTLLAVAALAAGAPAPPHAHPYRDGPPSAHTGGFGEAHCGACHFDAPVNDAGGGVVLDLPDRYRTGATYDVVITLRHPELGAAGFQLAARFATGEQAGMQAGRLEPADGRTQVVEAPAGVAYASHSDGGARAAEPGVGRWVVRWTAPSASGDVVFHLAANAADGDDSEFGDRIYLAERRVSASDAPKER